MKKQKGNVAVISTIVVIFAIAAGTIGWILAKKTAAPVATTSQANNVPSASTTVPEQNSAVQPFAPATPEEEVYTNTDYGFKLKIPVQWQGKQKISVSKGDANSFVAYVTFSFPTTDKMYADKTGYALYFDITVVNASWWNKRLQRAECKKNLEPDCPDPNAVVAKNNKYVFTTGQGQDFPKNFSRDYPYSVELIKNNFSLID